MHFLQAKMKIAKQHKNNKITDCSSHVHVLQLHSNWAINPFFKLPHFFIFFLYSVLSLSFTNQKGFICHLRSTRQRHCRVFELPCLMMRLHNQIAESSGDPNLAECLEWWNNSVWCTSTSSLSKPVWQSLFFPCTVKLPAILFALLLSAFSPNIIITWERLILPD